MFISHFCKIRSSRS